MVGWLNHGMRQLCRENATLLVLGPETQRRFPGAPGRWLVWSGWRSFCPTRHPHVSRLHRCGGYVRATSTMPLPLFTLPNEPCARGLLSPLALCDVWKIGQSCTCGVRMPTIPLPLSWRSAERAWRPSPAARACAIGTQLMTMLWVTVRPHPVGALVSEGDPAAEKATIQCRVVPFREVASI
jgi:hypothetical protein